MEKLKASETHSQDKLHESPPVLSVRGMLHRIFDSVRTSPFGLAITTAGVVEAVAIKCLMDYLSAFFPDTASFPYTMLPLLASPVVFGGIRITADHYSLRRYLERSCQEFGYSNRVFQITTKAWCNRQLARVVAEQYGKLNDYEALCVKHREKSQFTNLPHF